MNLPSSYVSPRVSVRRLIARLRNIRDLNRMAKTIPALRYSFFAPERPVVEKLRAALSQRHVAPVAVQRGYDKVRRDLDTRFR